LLFLLVPLILTAARSRPLSSISGHRLPVWPSPSIPAAARLIRATARWIPAAARRVLDLSHRLAFLSSTAANE
jgi:hypothetical protein